ncbi:phosphatidylglycerophosphatase [Malassezia vespertilionis]|uniref:Uncharacterized protein n=1 Tax=Malassezia vespertilionis TaxID=2020962 RepID=A0A2N1JHE9_9BASI|nr:phosphatidylglycerophosphatase [Malassezia vespertilionis]PKI85965.1 hypothetical protein MVES_000373 [Malassezia vespertilionis]WFD05070.1 phosphatidylglycerophosphatase [Malassezia vespertilionis]
MNLPGVWAVLHAALRPGIVRPNLVVPSLTQLDWHKIHASGVRYIIFDKDNCLTRPHEDDLVPELKHSWSECKKVFGAANMLLVSNSAGTCGDPRGLAAESVSAKLGVPVLCHKSKKPSKACALQVIGYLEEQSRRGASAIPRAVVIGDRLFTDVVFSSRIEQCLARNYSRSVPDFQTSTPLCSSVLTSELWARERLGTRLMRKFEQAFLRMLLRVGISPRGGWKDRAPYNAPAWLQTPLQPKPSFTSALRESELDEALGHAILEANASAYMKRMGKLGRGLLWVKQNVHRIPGVSFATGKVKELACIVCDEVFANLQHIRSLTWSTLTGAPSQRHRRTLPMAMRDAAVPPARNIVKKHLDRSGVRMFSTARCVAAQASHERPVPRRLAKAEEPAVPPTPVQHPQMVRTWLGVPTWNWVLALLTVIILPLGFIGGIKLNDLMSNWYTGSVSNEGHSANMQDFVSPAEFEAEQAKMEHESRKTNIDMIQNLEREHFQLRRERHEIQEKLARLEERMGLRGST